MKVLLTNDDGPPSPASPYIFRFYALLSSLGWDVKVVINLSGDRRFNGSNSYQVIIPSTQKSWIGLCIGDADR
jgi:broad specificity polyphosphatase/5'/3'-nucleotidase SurE